MCHHDWLQYHLPVTRLWDDGTQHGEGGWWDGDDEDEEEGQQIPASLRWHHCVISTFQTIASSLSPHNHPNIWTYISLNAHSKHILHQSADFSRKNFFSSSNPAIPRSVQSLILERRQAVVTPSPAHFATFSPRSLLAVLSYWQQPSAGYRWKKQRIDCRKLAREPYRCFRLAFAVNMVDLPY